MRLRGDDVHYNGEHAHYGDRFEAGEQVRVADIVLRARLDYARVDIAEADAGQAAEHRPSTVSTTLSREA